MVSLSKLNTILILGLKTGEVIRVTLYLSSFLNSIEYYLYKMNRADAENKSEKIKTAYLAKVNKPCASSTIFFLV